MQSNNPIFQRSPEFNGSEQATRRTPATAAPTRATARSGERPRPVHRPPTTRTLGAAG